MADPHTPTALVDWLDDLTVRFLLNIPAAELSSVPRLCFQVEEAQWYYEDFVRPAVAASGAPPLPSLSLRQFCLLLFQHCPLFNGFSAEHHLKAYEEFLAYKVRVPVRGAIMLDERMEKLVLVRGWKKGASWAFPRGKINKDEKDLHCAIREVWEETGFDLRAAGLVPENEDDVKAIDVTMREQHMRLFVFRGVPEDTHFEPRTRKEIGGIKWYAIKDLPGFKKQKAGQAQVGDAANTNKFYMVAPFLGHLKKWISQQRKEDAARATRHPTNGHESTLQTGTEDEGDLDEDTVPERHSGVNIRSEELKKLLSIGATHSQDSSSHTQPGRMSSDSANLLAMLQGSAKPTNGTQIPRTPFDQIDTFPQQPESPHPLHMRQTSSSEQQQNSPPQFPFPHPQLQESQTRYSSRTTPNVVDRLHDTHPSSYQPPAGYPGFLPQLQQAPPHRQSMPLVSPPGLSALGHQIGGSTRPPMPQLPPDTLPQHLTHKPRPPSPRPVPSNKSATIQGSQGAISSGPSAPNATQLQAPKQLGAEKMQLLDVFRNPSGKAVPATAPPQSTQSKHQQASVHQAALLDLFRRPSEPANSSAAFRTNFASGHPSSEIPEPASPTGTDVTIKPSNVRRPTLNEITRTLPLTNAKVKSPSESTDQAKPPFVATPPTTFQPQQNMPVRTHNRPEPQKARQLFDPNNPMKFIPGSLVQPPKTGDPVPVPKRQSRELKNTAVSPSPSRSVPGDNDHPPNGNRATPPVTILARPGSARSGPKSPAAPPSPLRNESSKPAFHPQLLKRPKDSDAAEGQHKSLDKKDQLLALFGKTASQTPIMPPSTTNASNAATPGRKESAGDQKNRLLDLFNTSPSVPTPTAAPSQPTMASPPPKPRIEPAQRPTSSKQQPVLSTDASKPQSTQQQNLLLDLFHNKRQSSSAKSPETPISPFTLGTPAVEQQQKRLGSLSGLANMAASPTEGGGQSPQEQKDFLMGFLNGVVRNEGSRNAQAGR